MTHVDIVKNEWLAGYRLVVARLWADNGDVHVEPIGDTERWGGDIVQQYIDRFDPATLIATLHEHLNGDYLFATEPHDEANCPYHEERIPLTALH